MWPRAKAVTAALALGAGLVHPVLSLDTTIPNPALSRNDPELFDCPLPCVEYDNIHTWTRYFSVSRLERCSKPMLLQFSTTQFLDDPATTVLIRACTLTSPSVSGDVPEAGLIEVENPKKSEALFDHKLDSAASCIFATAESDGQLQVAISTGDNSGVEVSVATGLLEGIKAFFDDPNNCDENFVFAWHNGTVGAAYIGAALGKPSIASAIDILANHFQDTTAILSNLTVAQLCSSERQRDRSLGIAIDTTADIAGLQRTALAWSQGDCVAVDGAELQTTNAIEGLKIFEINALHSNSTLRKRDICDYIQVQSGDGCWALADRCGISLNDFYTYNPDPNLCSNLAVNDYVCCSPGDPYTPSGPQPFPNGTCQYIQVQPGEGCWDLSVRCGISLNDFYDNNPDPDLCSNILPDDYVCCSSGTPYTPPPPEPQPDGTCATHLIQNGDTCAELARRYHVTVEDLEDWNAGKTWAWTNCSGMLLGYNMCISPGYAPLPPPQIDAQCGPLVPGTELPTNRSISLADLNPCPLNACCSNWGFCGPFPAHCEIHAPEGGGPGSKLPGYVSTCVSNCGTDIKVNGPAPASFQRVGYYQSYNFGRPCLWMSAKYANPGGAYTHLHWAFAEIDPNGWHVVINDPYNQWEDFKALTGVKKIIAFGGWAYSTEPETYNILRQAIIDHADDFTQNIAEFLEDEGLDGVDIDWEYPGAPDIYVNGQPIGQETDGADYKDFLALLKSRVGSTKTVSICAPASYWYLKAYPIAEIADEIDYIVYMTYDLHGQWDYGNVNAFDSCPSGKCIRSHVNLTETRSALSIITKAGVPNRKIFVGEASYGRSFHMADPECWGPMCDFTGTRMESDATPGRCTNTAGYISMAEIYEILKYEGGSAQLFFDNSSDSDIILYNGDYISFMSPTTKETRREEWEDLHFAGTVDWAVDLQTFGEDDKNATATRPVDENGEGCVHGADLTLNTADLCEFSCRYGFCPERLCECKEVGELEPLPSPLSYVNITNIIAHDEDDVTLHQLCRFACKYGYCPPSVCTVRPQTQDVQEIPRERQPDFKHQFARQCTLSEDPVNREAWRIQCENACRDIVDQAKSEGRTTNYGCVVFYPLDGPDPWYTMDTTGARYAIGNCSCDNWLVNEFASIILEAMPAVGQIGCGIVMSTVYSILKLGLNFFTGGAGRAIDAGLDMLLTAAQMASYLYDEEEDPAGAFEWWLLPCGGSDLVPEDIKNVFDILTSIGDFGGSSSFKPPKNLGKGSGRKGDSGNPTGSARSVSRPPPTRTSHSVPCHPTTKRASNNGFTVSVIECDSKSRTITNVYIATSATPAPTATTSYVGGVCSDKWSQACYHYSSAISAHTDWAKLPCPVAAMATSRAREDGKATSTWSAQHSGAGWQAAKYRNVSRCARDEYPPAYLLEKTHTAMVKGGVDWTGQAVRFIPSDQNSGAGSMWKGKCFLPLIKEMSDAELISRVKNAASKSTLPKASMTTTWAVITVDKHPVWTITDFEHTSRTTSVVTSDGLWQNGCWPHKIAPLDPGFALLTFDPYYGYPNNPRPPPYNYLTDAPTATSTSTTTTMTTTP